MNGEGAKSSIEINTFPLSIRGETFNSLEELEEHFLRQKLGKEAVQERVSEILAPTKSHGVSRRGFLERIIKASIAVYMPKNPLGGALNGAWKGFKIITPEGMKRYQQLTKMKTLVHPHARKTFATTFWSKVAQAEIGGRAGITGGLDMTSLPSTILDITRVRVQENYPERISYYDEYGPCILASDAENAYHDGISNLLSSCSKGPDNSLSEVNIREITEDLKHFIQGKEGPFLATLNNGIRQQINTLQGINKTLINYRSPENGSTPQKNSSNETTITQDKIQEQKHTNNDTLYHLRQKPPSLFLEEHYDNIALMQWKTDGGNN